MTGSPIENTLRSGWYVFWQDHTYRILSTSSDHLVIHVENIHSLEHHEFRLETLLLALPEHQTAPLFAPSLDALQAKIARQRSAHTTTPTADLPEELLARADALIQVVQTVEHQVAGVLHRTALQGEPAKRTEVIRQTLAQLDTSVSLSTYYRYLACYQQYSGDRGSIAASFRRTTFNQSAMNPAQLHFIDTLILRFYARQPPIRPSTLYKIAAATLKRTTDLWLDPNRCESDMPQDIVAELLNPDIPIEVLLDNPEKRQMLTAIDLPSRSWVYQYLHWFEQQPDQGQQVITARYGRDTWEREQMVFDTFVTRATLPLQYVFADHWLLDVFTLDEVTRSQPIRLWLTVLLDAYSRCVLGMALLHETPCIESIQHALRHAIWPKASHQALGLEGEWICYGIPQQLSLDNAWAHHSHSLENLARVISQGGEYNSIDLVFRPPYKGRYGALIERFFGNLSNRIQEHLPGAIHSGEARHLGQAAKQARLLYQDIYRILHQLILVYQHSPHCELDGLTPHEKWQHGMQWSFACVPPQTPDMDRLFWRLSPSTRVITTKGVSIFGMTYWSPDLARMPRVDMGGKRLRYHFRYDPADISQVALFQDGAWMGDVAAKDLRQPDGSLCSLSLWERQLARRLAQDTEQPDADWLHFVHDIDSLSQQRLQEKKKARRRTTNPTPPPDAQATEIAINETDITQTYQDYTALLARFMGKQEDPT
jgi:transposase InsO family protein